MSSPALPRSPAATSPMRQQLDDLDALLQRMLTLPVNQLPEPTEGRGPDSPAPLLAVKSRAKISPPAEPASIARNVSTEEGAPLPPEPEARPAPVPRNEPPTKLRGPIVMYQPISSPTAIRVAEPPSVAEDKASVLAPTVVAPKADTIPGWGPAVADKPPPLPAPAPAEPMKPILAEPHSPFLERHRARLREQHRAAPWLGPLGWINLLFDRTAVALGRPGLWLVRAEGRNILGWLGVGMLLAAGVILAGDWFGWTW